jgi:hypothetical protein
MYNTMDNTERRTEGQRKLMTTGRQIAEPLEDANYVYINSFVIPKGKDKADIEAREEVTMSMYRCWCAENPSRKRRNKNLKTEIEVNDESIKEVKHHTGKSWKNALAFYYLDFILKNSIGEKKDNPISSNQKKLAKGGYMLQMKLDNFENFYFSSLKVMVAVTRKKDTILYSITAIEVGE